MARIDGILKLVSDQGGTELRIAAGRPPELFRDGEGLTFTLPTLSDHMMRELVIDLLTDEQQGELSQGEEVLFSYGTSGAGAFFLRLRTLDDGLHLLVWPTRTGKKPPGEGDGESTEGNALDAEPDVSPVGSDHLVPRPSSTVATAAASSPQSVVVHDVPVSSQARARALAPLLDLLDARRASDLHWSEGSEPMLRLSGRLVTATQEWSSAVFDDALSESERRRVEAGDSLDLGIDRGLSSRYRVTVFRCRTGFSVAIRRLDRTAPALARLGFPMPLDSVVDLPHGLVLVCGPTGSGKSTTLAALARARLQRAGGVLVTLEDPIELLIPEGERPCVVRQREVGRDVVNFASGLRTALRSDPDVLLIGELRDTETVELALSAAETGHLVLASLHSRSATGAVARIVDACSAERASWIRAQLADALRVVLAQRLLPAKDGGRVLAAEVLKVSSAVANLIREGRTPGIRSALQTGRAEGMLPLDRHLAQLVRTGRVDPRVAAANAVDPETFRAQL